MNICCFTSSDGYYLYEMRCYSSQVYLISETKKSCNFFFFKRLLSKKRRGNNGRITPWRTQCLNIFHFIYKLNILKLLVDGRWSDWIEQSCSVTCGEGSRLRYRKCSNPYPQHGGKKCTGKRTDHVKCIQPIPCPGN